MKRILIIALILSSFSVFGQEDVEKTSVTIGILQGGGSLVGMDLEALVSDRVGLQVGAGFVGFGAAVNFHFKPSIRSSFLSLQYWNQGFGSSFIQSLVGPSFVYRGKKWFTCQIGLGFTLNRGPAYPPNQEQYSTILTYAIGAYIPF